MTELLSATSSDGYRRPVLLNAPLSLLLFLLSNKYAAGPKISWEPGTGKLILM